MPKAIVYIGSRSPFVLSQEAGVYEKELIYVGEFKKGGQRFDIDEAMLLHWERTFNEMTKNGVEVPVPIEHTTDPEKRRGTLVGTLVKNNKRGIPALFGLFKFRDPEAEKLTRSANVSIYSPPEFVDGNGNRYVRPIAHVALTDYPVVPHLGKFEAIAASYTGDVKMSLMSLAEKLGIPIADKSEESIEAELTAAIAKMQEELDKHKKQPGELEGEGEGVDAGEGEGEPKESVPMAASFVNMLKDNRSMKINRLVEQGKITPAVKKRLEDQYLKKETLELSLSGKKDDGFDALIDTLNENEPVMSFTEKTRAQAVVLSQTKVDPASNPLVADAERRAKERAGR